MKHISLGGLDVSRIGLGTMAMSGYYLDPSSSDAESIRTLQRALELGVTHIDTAEIYGPYANEELVGRALEGRREDVVVATKFGFVSHSRGGLGVLDSSPANVRAAVEGSLTRLGTDRIDLYYQHRVDPNTPIEETVGALAELVTEGKVLHIGLSEAGPDTIRRAHAIGTVALAEGVLVQAGLMSHRPASVPARRSSLAGFRFPPEVIMLAVRWYLRYSLSYRDVAELLAERGIAVDHVTLYRWVQRFTPELIDAARPSRHVAGDRWFVDETYLKVAGQWVYLYRAIDQHGQVIDVLAAPKRDLVATRQFFARALSGAQI